MKEKSAPACIMAEKKVIIKVENQHPFSAWQNTSICL